MREKEQQRKCGGDLLTLVYSPLSPLINIESGLQNLNRLNSGQMRTLTVRKMFMNMSLKEERFVGPFTLAIDLFLRICG